jgi:antitoxin YefM
MNSLNEPRRDVTLQEKSDAVGTTMVTENGLNETVQLLKTPANAAHLARSIEQFRKGEVRQQGLVDAE